MPNINAILTEPEITPLLRTESFHHNDAEEGTTPPTPTPADPRESDDASLNETNDQDCRATTAESDDAGCLAYSETISLLSSLLPQLPIAIDHAPYSPGDRVLHVHLCEYCWNAYTHRHVISTPSAYNINLCPACTRGVSVDAVRGSPLYRRPADASDDCVRDSLAVLGMDISKGPKTLSDLRLFATEQDCDLLVITTTRMQHIRATGQSRVLVLRTHNGHAFDAAWETAADVTAYRGPGFPEAIMFTGRNRASELLSNLLGVRDRLPKRYQAEFDAAYPIEDQERTRAMRSSAHVPPPAGSRERQRNLNVRAPVRRPSQVVAPRDTRAPARSLAPRQRQIRSASYGPAKPTPVDLSGRLEPGVVRAVPGRRARATKPANSFTSAYLESASFANAYAGDHETAPNATERGAGQPRQRRLESARFLSTDHALTPERHLDIATNDMPETAIQAVERLTSWINDDTPLPPRFADQTKMLKTLASGIVTLSGANFTEGNTLYVLTPTLQANRGVVIFQMAPGDTKITTASLVATVVPDKDAELVGALMNVVGARLAVGIQQSTGADAGVKAFSNVFEGGVCTVNPIAALPGKLAYVTEAKKSLSQMITSETMVVCDHTANLPDNLVRLGNDFDPQSNNVRVPNGYQTPPASASIEGSQRFAVHAWLSTDSQTNQHVGFTPSIVPDGYVFTGDELTVWNLKNHASFNRHLLMDGFTINVANALWRDDTNTAASLAVDVSVYFIDGTNVRMRQFINNPTLNEIHNFGGTWVFDGAGAPAEKAGIPIVDIELVLNPDSEGPNSKVFFYTGFSIQVDFHNISAASRYPCVMITGAKEGQTLSIHQSCDVEVKVDPTGDIGRYIDVDHDAASANSIYAHIQEKLRRRGLPMLFTTEGGKTRWHSGTFGEGLKRFFGGLFKTLAPLAGPAANLLVPGSGAIVGPLAAGAASRMRSMTFADDDYVPELLSATFKASPQRLPTGFQFPLITTDRLEGAVADVVRGGGKSPAHMVDHFIRPLSARPDNFSGESNNLAFLLASLGDRGAPVHAGLYSGEIRNLRANNSSATFDLLPVAAADEKDALYADSALAILTADGFHESGLVVPLEKTDMFSGFDRVRAREIAPPEGYPGAAFHVTLNW